MLETSLHTFWLSQFINGTEAKRTLNPCAPQGPWMLPERIAYFRTSIRIEARPELSAGLAGNITKPWSCLVHIGSTVKQISLGQPPRKHMLATICMILCMICIQHLSTCTTFAPVKSSWRALMFERIVAKTSWKPVKPSQLKFSLGSV